LRFQSMRKALALLLTSLLIATTLPTSVAADEPEPIAWGIEYDYTNLNTDIASMIGIDLQEVFQEVMAAGDDSGIDLLIGSVTTGTTTIVFEQYDGPMATLSVDGTPTDFSTKVTELTVRHGILDDFAIHSEWSDSFGGIDLTIGYDSEQLFNADVVYTEYFDSDMGLHGMDMEMEIEAMIEYTIGFSGELSGDGETLPFDIDFTIGTSFDINNGLLEVRMDEASPLYTEQADLEAGEQLQWHCNDDMDYEDEPYVNEDMEYNDDGEMYTSIDIGDGCADHNIHYETETSVLLELTGIPTEEFGLPAGDFDVTISDTVTDMYDGEVELFFMGGVMGLLDEPTQMITIDDGSAIEVHQAYASPTPMPFPAMWAMLWANSVVGSGDYPGIVDALLNNENFEEAFGSWADDILEGDEGEEEYFICANLNEIPYDYVEDGYDDCGDNSDEEFVCDDGEVIYGSWVNDGDDDCANGEDETYKKADDVEIYLSMKGASESEMEFDYEVYGMDYDENYEISWTVTDDEGTTSDAGSDAVTDGSNEVYATEYAEIDGFGEYCIDIEVTRMSDNQVVGTEQECDSVSQDIEPSDRLITIVEALGESTLENTMESFGQNLENRLSGFEDDFDIAYEDGMIYALYDTDTDRFVGFQLVASPGGTQWYTLIGPESTAYGTPQRGVSVTYFTGIAAVEEAAEIEDQTDLSDLVDVTQHNTYEVDAVNDGVDPETLPDEPNTGENGETVEDGETGEEITEEEVSGLLPFLSPITTLAMIALAGMFVSIRSKDE
jgi:hypothetical protein